MVSKTNRSTFSQEKTDFRVRELRFPDDSKLVSEIAERTAGFTKLSPYVIWMMVETQGPICRVAIDQRGSLCGYVLAFRTSNPGEAFVWQLGVQKDTLAIVISIASALVRSLGEVAESNNISTFKFTAQPKRMRTLLKRIFSKLGLRPEPTNKLFEFATGSLEAESEFLIKAVRPHKLYGK